MDALHSIRDPLAHLSYMFETVILHILCFLIFWHLLTVL